MPPRARNEKSSNIESVNICELPLTFENFLKLATT